MILPKFQYLQPKSLAEACALVAKYGEKAKVLAGGTDLLVKMKQGLAFADYLISLGKVSDLNFIDEGKEVVRVGAMTTLTEILESSLIQKKFFVLAEAVGTMAAVQVRNTGTIGGNLCNASPAADTAPVLIAMGAKARIVGQKGERRVPLEDFFAGPGNTVLKPGELLADIEIPYSPPGTGGAYVRYGLRRSSALAVVAAAAMITVNGQVCQEAKVALGAVAPTPVRARGAEEVLRGQRLEDKIVAQAGLAASQEARPISDIRGSEEYRRELTSVLTRRAILKAAERAKGRR